jgi:hypothetical protein
LTGGRGAPSIPAPGPSGALKGPCMPAPLKTPNITRLHAAWFGVRSTIPLSTAIG